ncbi:hypothetical protein DSM43518_02299 [Mycobacterium marinum]|uniref:hypothetical protein n=1 Tax=Mycobacterium marinum TaxID=1781 RepID=UPI000ED8000F|nr:hypothetical protein [Mycobacterium marinum]RFZ10385.1 hypothetical protein DSM43518_02299 [Mycobacterium marinum]RFZ63023.1 hypothetical protein DE4576_04962 [Mycobacterium marinum]
MARESSIPIPAARGRAVSPDAARVRGGASNQAAPPAAQPGPAANPVADYVAHDPALELLRNRKVKRTGLNVHINSHVSDAFAAFIDSYDLPKGDTVSLALQEFLERRGVQIPGVARVSAPPMSAVPNTEGRPVTGGDLANDG